MKAQLFEINSEKDFKEVIEKNKGLLIVDFTSPVCPPCLMLEPVLEELVDKDICSVAKINVLTNQELAAKYAIQATPTIIIFKDSEIKKSALGYQPFEAWVKLLETI